MKKVKKILTSKIFVIFIWITALFVLWEVCAAHVAETKRTPENILPHISGIINSLLSDKKINGSQTALQMVLENAGATLSRAGVGYLIGIASGLYWLF